MKRKRSLLIKTLVILVNSVIAVGSFYSLWTRQIFFEVFMALMFSQALINGFLLYKYILYKKAQQLAEKLDFQFLTIYFEQPRMEGMYKKNWWQIHMASRPYGEYWGIPRTYIKLQYKKKKKFDKKVLAKCKEHFHGGMKVNSVEHIKRPYKNYLLMKVRWYRFDKKKIHHLMDHLLDIAEEAKK